MSITKTRRSHEGHEEPLYRNASWPSWGVSCLRNMPMLRTTESALRNKPSDELTNCQAGRQPRRLDAGGVHDARILRISPNHEIRERLRRRMQLGTDPAARKSQIGDGDHWQQLARGFGEVLDRQAIALVV